jgi:hypothetical protein
LRSFFVNEPSPAAAPFAILKEAAMDEEDFQNYHEAMVRGPLRAPLRNDATSCRGGAADLGQSLG